MKTADYWMDTTCQRALNDLWRIRLSHRRTIWHLSHPLPLPSAKFLSFSVFLCVSVELIAGFCGGGREWERSQVIRLEKNTLYKSFNILSYILAGRKTGDLKRKGR
jgi:hypothetical protein